MISFLDPAMNLTFKAIFLVCLLPLIHSGPVIVKDTPLDYNLPDGLSPNEYTLTLKVDVDTIPNPGSTYDGNVKISLEVTSEDGVSEVKLHSYKTIHINAASLQQQDGKHL